jgi:hypothetical protein
MGRLLRNWSNWSNKVKKKSLRNGDEIDPAFAFLELIGALFHGLRSYVR